MRLHPLSVPYRALTRSLNLGTLVVLGGLVGSGSVGPQSLGFVGLLVAGLGTALAYEYARYRRFDYDVTADSLEIASGVVSRRQREIPLGRIQNVDVAENPLQRALGIARLRVETAGGDATEAALEYVARGEADRLREVLRGRAPAPTGGDGIASQGGETDTGEDGRVDGTADDATAGERSAGDTGRATGEATPEAGHETVDRDGETVFVLGTRRLLLVSALTFDAGAGAISSVVAAVVGGNVPGAVDALATVADALPGGPALAAGLAVAAFVVFAWLVSFALTFSRYYGYRLERREAELTYERGLFQRYSGTVPVEKVQTVSVRDNPLERAFGYASLAVETAGYAPGSDAGAAETAVPLAEREVVVAVARSIEAFEPGDLEVERPPRRARRRYAVRYLLVVAGLTAALAVGARLGLDPRLDRWPAAAALALPALGYAHLKWRHRGHRVGRDHFVARSGVLGRTTRVVPYYRLQTVVATETVFQRRRRLASVTADTASSSGALGGDATAFDVDEAVATDLVADLRERLTDSLRERGRAGQDDERDRSEGSGDGRTAREDDRGDRETGGGDGSEERPVDSPTGDGEEPE